MNQSFELVMAIADRVLKCDVLNELNLDTFCRFVTVSPHFSLPPPLSDASYHFF